MHDEPLIRVGSWLFTRCQCNGCYLNMVTVKITPDLYLCRVCLDRNKAAQAWVALQPDGSHAAIVDAYQTATDRLGFALLNRVVRLIKSRGGHA